jgi:hypothetical protein
MTQSEPVIAEAQAVLDEAWGLMNDLATGNIDEEHPAAFENPDERRRRLDDFQHRADACRSRLEQEFSGDIVEDWENAIGSLRSMIDGAFEGRVPTGHPSEAHEFSELEAAAERYAEKWQQTAKRALGAESA